MKILLLLTITVFTAFYSFAQSGRDIKGTVKDSTGISIIAATIKLTSAQDTLMTRSDADGAFVFRNVKSSQFLISITNLGYRSFNKRFLYKESTSVITLDPIILKSQANVLGEVVVNGTPAVTVKEDTVEYRASDFPVRENSVVEDVLKKLPGVEVDKDGNVKAQGKSVTKVRVNGKDFFNGDLKTATQQLPADIIEKIQIIDDYGDQANLTGIKEGEPDKIVNIQIRPDRNKGIFGRGNIGGGNNDRYQLGAVGNYFNNTRQISFMGNLNNTNSSIFNFGGGGISFGGRGGRGGSGASGNNTGEGITSLGSIGLNYRDEWSKKLSSYGSYSFFNRSNDVVRSSIQENNYSNGIITDSENNISNTISSNHRFNWNLEYKPDSLNYFKISPTFSYSDNNGNQTASSFIQTEATKNSDGTTIENSSSNTPAFGGSLLYNHRFRKAGRNLSFNVSLNNSEVDRDKDVNDRTLYYNPNGTLSLDSLQHQLLETRNRTFTGNSRVSYIEPLSKTQSLEVSWAYKRSDYDNNRITNSIDEQGTSSRLDSLSNIFDYSFTTNRIGLSYRFNNKNYNYTLGMSAQPTLLQGHSESLNTNTSRTGFNIIPVARFEYKFSRTRSFNINYNGRSNEPDFAQLQPVPDVSNPQYPVYGNPDLQAEFNHTLNIRYNNFDPNSGNSIFTNVSATVTQDKIVNNVVVVPLNSNNTNRGIRQEMRYLNTDGYYNINGFYSWSKPLAEKKYTVSLNGSANYNNNISFSNNEKNIGNNWIFAQGLRLQMNPGDWLEFNPSVNYTYNINSYSINQTNNSQITTWSLNTDGRLYFLKTFILGFDVSKNFNQGYSGTLAQNPFIVNTYFEKQFFKDKSATLRLQAFDLLDQNINVSRNIINNGTLDSRSNRLGQYFMLSFTMRIRKFNGQQSNFRNGRDRMNFRRNGPEEANDI